jgi:tetratricopeptide (TPR) repeat protein
MIGRFGEVHVMDWGLAKILGAAEPAVMRESPPAARPRSPTLAGDVLGTPSHMAPEQAKGDPLAIDRRADVYGVGAILHHALFGVPPNAAGADDSRANVPKELRAVCRRALRADARERYDSVAELAGDLRAFLEHRVVQAHRIGRWERAKKWVARNRRLAVTLAVAALLLVVAAFASYVGIRNRRAAVVASHREQDLNALIGFFGALFGELERQELGLPLVAALDASVDAMLPGVARVDADPSSPASAEGAAFLSENPALQAAIFESIAGSYRHLGSYQKALPLQLRALEIRERLFGGDDLSTIGALMDLASTCRPLSKFVEARRYLEQAVESGLRVYGSDEPQTLVAENNLASLLIDLGEFQEAESSLAETLPRMERVFGPDDRRTMAALSNVADLRKRQGRSDEAEALLRRWVETERRLPNAGVDLYSALNTLGELLLRRGKLDEAENLLKESLAGRERVVGKDHRDSIATLSNLASVYEAQARFSEAEALFRDGLARCERGLEPDNLYALTVEQNFGRLLKNVKKYDEAEIHLRASYERRRRVLGDDHRETLVSLGSLGSLRRAEGQLDAAETAFREAFERGRARYGADDPDTLRAASNLCAALVDLGREDEAEELLLDTHARIQRLGAKEFQLILERVRFRLTELYEARHARDPGAGWDVKADAYR